jgi:hypothetical protein
MAVKRCLDSNPEISRSKQACKQLSHPGTSYLRDGCQMEQVGFTCKDDVAVVSWQGEDSHFTVFRIFSEII